MKKIIEITTADPGNYYGVSTKIQFEDGSEAIPCDFCEGYFSERGLRIHFSKMHKNEKGLGHDLYGCNCGEEHDESGWNS